MASHERDPPQDEDLQDEDLLDIDEAEEEIDEDGDRPMDDDEDEEIELQNDSAAYFDAHNDSIFCIAQHPTNPSIIATGGGDDLGYVFDATIAPGPVLPSSYESEPKGQGERAGLPALEKLEGHKDSVNAIAFTLPKGEYLLTAGLDGQLRAHQSDKSATQYKFFADASEVQEINWLDPCPNPDQPNVVALGANDGSVWVYQVNAADKSNPLTIIQAFYLHQAPSTAGSWTPDGKLLATVSEDGSLYVWDVFETGQAVVSQTSDDQRFAIDGGLYSVACTQSLVAVGGATGEIRVVGLPQAAEQSKKNKAGKGANTTASSGGQIIASLHAQAESIETLTFSAPPLTMLAAGSVDGSIALFDTAHRFAVRRHIKDAHDEHAVVKLAFLRNSPRGGHILTSAGMDGVVKRWDVRGGTTAAGQGFLKEWKGHRGDGEGGGVLGFVQGGAGNVIVTAGDDGVSLVFKAEIA